MMLKGTKDMKICEKKNKISKTHDTTKVSLTPSDQSSQIVYSLFIIK